MKTRTKVLYGTLFAVLVMSAPFAAEARHFGRGSTGGPGMHYGWQQQISPEQEQQIQVLRQQHFDKIQAIREELWKKQMTLDALSANPKVEPKEITALVDEIFTLRTRLFTERKNFAAQVKKDTGLDMPMGAGGGGYGYGHNGRRGGGHHNGGNGGGYGHRY